MYDFEEVKRQLLNGTCRPVALSGCKLIDGLFRVLVAEKIGIKEIPDFQVGE